MTSFSGPAPVDMLFLRMKGKKMVWSVPLCEVIPGKLTVYDPPEYISTMGNEKGKSVIRTYTEKELLEEVNQQIKPIKAESFALLMEGELANPNLTLFLDKNS